MVVRFRKRGFSVGLALGLMALWCVNDAFPRGALRAGQDAPFLIQEGKRLYESGDYEAAVRILLEGLRKAKAKTEESDARFYLSLSYYALGRPEDSRSQLEQLFEIQPDRTIDERFYAAGFVDLYNKIRAEKPRKQEPAPAMPRVATKEAPGKPAGRKGFPWLIVGGAVVAAGVGAVLLLGKKESTPSLPTAGSIAVASDPAGAKVFLDGADTGQRSNCTLTNVSPGSHALRLDLEDYGRWEGQVSVTAGQTTQVNAVLGPFPYEFVSAWGSSGSGNRQFNEPKGICINSTEAIYIADSGNHRIQRFSPGGDFQQKWGSYGSANGKFSWPLSIAFASGYVFVADSENNRIQKFTTGGGYVAKWGTEGENTGQFRTPMGVASNGSDKIYVADSINHRIQAFKTDGSFITAWGSPGQGDGQFNYPIGIAVNKDGFVYVADNQNHRIQKFRSDGTFVLKFGSKGQGNGQFSEPWGIAIDRYGYVFVADSDNHRVQKWSPEGRFMIRWGQLGSDLRSFSQPKGICCDESDNVYILDTGNNRVQTFKISTQAARGSASVRTAGPLPPPAGLRPGRRQAGPPRGVPVRPSERRDKNRE